MSKNRACHWVCVLSLLVLVLSAAPGLRGSPFTYTGDNPIGIITGAYLDDTTGEVVLVGNGELPELTPTESVIATAFQWVYPETPKMPYVSIDPIPEDPEGPFMVIDFDPVSRNTVFGWVMFEADRLLKCLSLGSDNVFRLPETSEVPGYMNIFDLTEKMSSDKKGGEAVWSRFWFHPLVNQVQWDEDAIRILDCRVGVKTEVMTLENGKLVSTGGKQDPEAKAFSDHFTKNYREFGKEFPVFMALEQQARLLLIADWLRHMREKKQPVSLAWVRSKGGNHFRMPSYTPSLHESRTTSITKDGQVVGSYTMRLFGGVDLGIKPKRIAQDSRFENWRKGVEDGVTSTAFKEGRGTAGTEKLATVGKNANPRSKFEGEHALIHVSTNGNTYSMKAREDVLSRNPLADKSQSELAMPFLPSFLPKGIEGKTMSFWIEGKPESKIPQRVYELTSPKGEKLGWFDKHSIDPIGENIVVENSRDPSSNWRLSPDRANSEVMWAIEGNRKRWAFEIKSGEPIAEVQGDQLYRIGYNRRGKLEKVEGEGLDAGELVPVLEVRRDYETGPVTSLRSPDDQRITLRSEARERRSEVLEFEATNETREKKKIRYEPTTDTFTMAEGGRLSESGFESVEVLRDKVTNPQRSEARVSEVISEQGRTVSAHGDRLTVVPATISEWSRQVAKAMTLPLDVVMRSKLADFLPSPKSGESQVVANESPSLRQQLTVLLSRMYPKSMLVSAKNPVEAVRKMETIERELDHSERGDSTSVKFDRESLKGQERSEEFLEPSRLEASSGSFRGVLKAIVAHYKESSRKVIEDYIRDNPGGVHFCLFCNTNAKAGESQRLADHLAEIGGGVVILPRGLLDARDANRVVKELEANPLKDGVNPVNYVRELLERLGLADSFFISAEVLLNARDTERIS